MRFSREPAAWLNALSALIALMIGMGWFGLTENVGQAVVAFATAVTGAVVAWKVRPMTASVLATVLTTGVALGSALDWFHLTERQVGLWVAALDIGLTLLAVRPQSTPIDDPRPPEHAI